VSRLKNNPIPLSGATNLSAESPEYIFFLLFKETEFFEYFERIFKTYPGSLFLGKLNPTKVDTYINLVSYNLFNFLKNPHVSFRNVSLLQDSTYRFHAIPKHIIFLKLKTLQIKNFTRDFMKSI